MNTWWFGCLLIWLKNTNEKLDIWAVNKCRTASLGIRDTVNHVTFNFTWAICNINYFHHSTIQNIWTEMKETEPMLLSSLWINPYKYFKGHGVKKSIKIWVFSGAKTQLNKNLNFSPQVCTFFRMVWFSMSCQRRPTLWMFHSVFFFRDGVIVHILSKKTDRWMNTSPSFFI
jgi:hypothetical protein